MQRNRTIEGRGLSTQPEIPRHSSSSPGAFRQKPELGIGTQTSVSKMVNGLLCEIAKENGRCPSICRNLSASPAGAPLSWPVASRQESRHEHHVVGTDPGIGYTADVLHVTDDPFHRDIAGRASFVAPFAYTGSE